MILNSAPITLPPDPKGHIFLDLMAVADIDMTDPPRNAIMILTLNGKDASVTDPLCDGDTAVIRWDR